jgi:hypothetical protein
MPNKFLAVEGKDEVNFFEKWFKLLEIRGVTIKPAAGKDNFRTELPALIRSSEFEEASLLAIIRDADGNAQGEFDSIISTLNSNEIQSLGYSLSIPDSPNTFSDSDLSIGIFIIENELEDLCLKSLKSPEVEPCVDKFFECLPKNLEENIKKKSKARLQTYLSAMNENCNSLGVAAQKGYFDFEAKALEPLKEFLMCLKQAD